MVAPVLTLAEQRRLLEVARAAIVARVRGTGATGGGERAADGEEPGAFVTIHCRGELRGCLGRLARRQPLEALIHHLAQEVADSDPRFDPVRPDELSHITIEISVLTLEREVASITEIEVGRHGLIAERGGRRGVLLPQVAVEHGWTRETFVAQTCVKAGLAPDAWRRGARLLVFEAHVFGEDEV